jgi:DNA-binding Lrp family transcriptional regulator
MTVYVLVKTEAELVHEVYDSIRNGVPEVTSIAIVVGPYNLLVTLVVGSYRHLGLLLSYRIQPIGGVCETLTHIQVEFSNE